MLQYYVASLSSGPVKVTSIEKLEKETQLLYNCFHYAFCTVFSDMLTTIPHTHTGASLTGKRHWAMHVPQSNRIPRRLLAYMMSVYVRLTALRDYARMHFARRSRNNVWLLETVPTSFTALLCLPPLLRHYCVYICTWIGIWGNYCEFRRVCVGWCCLLVGRQTLAVHVEKDYYSYWLWAINITLLQQ